MKAYLLLANGMVFEGRAFGAAGTSVGEVVFNTGMVGYEETLTDPSYYGQIITQTYPLVGNYGVNGEDAESARIWAFGYIVRELCGTPSNFRCQKTLDEFLKEQGIIGIAGVDTRRLTRIIRESGVMNGALTIGTMDGANVEICEAVGRENIFIFGMETPEAEALAASGNYEPMLIYQNDPVIKGVLDHMIRGFGDGVDYTDIANLLLHGGNGGPADRYMSLKDFSSYAVAQERVGEMYRRPENWNYMSLMNIANSGRFAADRSVAEYAQNIWRVKTNFAF